MLLELIFNLVFLPIDGFLYTVQGLTLPLNLITVLGNITTYGCWVMGSDLFILFITLIFTFYALRFTISLVEWVWHLIPFC